MTLDEIDNLAKAHRKNVDALEKLCSELNDQIDAIKSKADARLKVLSSKCAVSELNLSEALEEAPELFVKPRTTELHGLKVGYQAGRESLEFDEEKTLAAIKKKLTELQAVLIKTTEKTVSSALKNLPPEQKKLIGVKVVPGSDQVVVKIVDSATDKLVGAHIAASRKSMSGS